jgi:hypothetical protein
VDAPDGGLEYSSALNAMCLSNEQPGNSSAELSVPLSDLSEAFLVELTMIASLEGEALEGDGQEDIGGDHTG